MAQIVDVRGSGGNLIVLGGALTLPTSANSVATVVAGSIRYNTTTSLLELYNGSAWVQATGTTGVTTWNGRSGGVTLLASDISSALGFVPLGSATVLNYSALPTSLKTFPLVYSSPGLQAIAAQVWTIPVAIAFSLLLNSPGSLAYAGVVAHATAVYTLAFIRSGTSTTIGTITFAASSHIGTFATAAYSAQVGDIITLTTPSVQDQALANVGIVVLGARST